MAFSSFLPDGQEHNGSQRHGATDEVDNSPRSSKAQAIEFSRNYPENDTFEVIPDYHDTTPIPSPAALSSQSGSIWSGITIKDTINTFSDGSIKASGISATWLLEPRKEPRIANLVVPPNNIGTTLQAPISLKPDDGYSTQNVTSRVSDPNLLPTRLDTGPQIEPTTTSRGVNIVTAPRSNADSPALLLANSSSRHLTDPPKLLRRLPSTPAPSNALNRRKSSPTSQQLFALNTSPSVVKKSNKMPSSILATSAVSQLHMKSPISASSQQRRRPGPGPGPGPGPQIRVGIPTKLEARPVTYNQMAASHNFGPSAGKGPQPTPVSFEKEWQKIEQLRIETWGLRSKIQEMRKELRERQYAKSNADDKYFQYIRMHTLGVKFANQDISQLPKSLDQLRDECQRARDEYGPFEDDCNLLEDDLDRAEYELTKLEKNFYNRQRDPQNFRVEELHYEPSSPIASVHSESDGEDDCHPLVSKFMSKLGDVDIYQERLAYHVDERFALEDEKESRLRVGRELAKEDQEWLNNYAISESQIKTQIAVAEQEAEMLKQQCMALGLVDEKGKPTSFESQERQAFSKDAGLEVGSELSEFVKFPKLLSKPGCQDIQFRDTAPVSDEISGSPGDHINQWLLHQLRSSPLSVSLLVRTFEAKFGTITGGEWELKVLTFWYRDGARKGASEYRIYSTGVLTQAPRKSRKSHFSGRSLTDGSGHKSLGSGSDSGTDSIGSKET